LLKAISKIAKFLLDCGLMSQNFEHKVLKS